MTIDPFEPAERTTHNNGDHKICADGPDTGQWEKADQAELTDTRADRAAIDRMLGEGGDGTAPVPRLTNSTQMSLSEQGNDDRLPATAPVQADDGLGFFSCLLPAKDRYKPSGEEDHIAPKPGELEG